MPIKMQALQPRTLLFVALVTLAPLHQGETSGVEWSTSPARAHDWTATTSVLGQGGLTGNDGGDQEETITPAREQRNAEEGGVRLTWAKLIGVLVAAGVFSGLLTEAFKLAMGWVGRRTEARKTARNVVLQHLDPILKAGDELVGKLHSLAREDFKPLHRRRLDEKSDFDTIVDLGNVMYLFAHFWARLEILRLESLYVNLNADEAGKKLMALIRCLESRRRRVLDSRAYQRGIGESLFVDDGGKRDCLTFYQFIDGYAQSGRRAWYRPLASLLGQTHLPRVRQKILLYGTLVHALLDTLDPDHLTTKRRDGYANKLSRKSKKTLRYVVFPRHLPFVPSPDKYATTGGRLAAS